MGRRRKTEDSEMPASWIVTYGDLMSLLLCFFILLFAFSTIDMVRFREAIISLQAALGVLTGGPRLMAPDEMPVPPISPSQVKSPVAPDRELHRLKDVITEYLREQGLEGKVTLELNRRGLLIRFSDTILFDLGKADLRPDSRGLLWGIGSMLQPLSNEILVEGHTDDLPLRPGAGFPTNWELSTARASTVVRYFIETVGLAPERLGASGYSQYRPVAPNTSAENRQMNRRVDIVIVAEDEMDMADLDF